MLKKAIAAYFLDAENAIEQRHASTIAAADLSQYLVLDVREENEFAQGHLPGAINTPRSRLEIAFMGCEPLLANTKPVLLYCKSGHRSLLAAKTLQDLGVDNPISMLGGFTEWQADGKEITGDDHAQ